MKFNMHQNSDKREYVLDSNLKNLKSFYEERDAFNCSRFRARVFQLPIDYSNDPPIIYVVAKKKSLKY